MFWSCNAVRHQKQHPFRNKRNSFRSPSSSVHCKYQYTYNSVKVRILLLNSLTCASVRAPFPAFVIITLLIGLTDM